jgi:hypothetical protein
MVRIYAVVLVIGLITLVAWILAHSVFAGSPRVGLDPEERFGIPGRRVVAGLVGFSMAGLSAEFSPRDLSWPVALVLALVGAAVLAWYAGRPIFTPGSGVPNGEAHSTEVSD